MRRLLSRRSASWHPISSARTPANGHAHVFYRLAPPVLRTSTARLKPLRFLAAVQRGMVSRLRADPRYGSLIAKNPACSAWRDQWLAPMPYSLAELSGWLDPREMRPAEEPKAEFGLGRNCLLFDQVRQAAYHRVCEFMTRNASESEFRSWVERIVRRRQRRGSASLYPPAKSGALRSRSRSGPGGTSPLRRSPHPVAPTQLTKGQTR